MRINTGDSIYYKHGGEIWTVSGCEHVIDISFTKSGVFYTSSTGNIVFRPYHSIESVVLSILNFEEKND